MSEPERDSQANGRLFEEAAAWFARMRAPDGQASRADFEAWLARGASHRAAYNRAAEIFAMGKVLGDERDTGTSGQPAAQRRTRQWMPVLAAAALAAIAASWIMFAPARFPGSMTAQSTREAEFQLSESASGIARSVRLADGSLIILQRGSRLDIAYDSTERRLTLLGGKARFEVAHERRPFVVHAGGGSVTAHGTIFEVALSSDRHVSVRLIEGVVDVALPSGSRGGAGRQAVRQMHRGEALSFTAASGPAPTGAAEVSGAAPSPSASASRLDARDYDQIRLGDLIANANSKASRPIRLADPSLADRRVSGRFRIDDPGLLAERIATLFGLAVDRSDPSMIVLKRP